MHVYWCHSAWSYDEINVSCLVNALSVKLVDKLRALLINTKQDSIVLNMQLLHYAIILIRWQPQCILLCCNSAWFICSDMRGDCLLYFQRSLHFTDLWVKRLCSSLLITVHAWNGTNLHLTIFQLSGSIYKCIPWNRLSIHVY